MGAKRDRQRVGEVIAIFLKHGMKKGIRGINNPVQMRLLLENLGPTFIKIGQILSTRPDLLPESFIKEFEKLQDSVKPEKYEAIKTIVEADLKDSTLNIFLSFDKSPIASASMAQVHLAELKDKERVVVKVQRPKARDTMFSDISILKRVSKLMKYTPHGSVLNIEGLADELWEAAQKELDFLNEAQNIKKFAHNNSDIKYITYPMVYDMYTTSNILVMDYIEGIKIDSLDALNDEGYDLNDITIKLVSNYFKQIFEDGFFHADPHPGNIIISQNKIAYVDFGMMGTLSNETRGKFNRFLYSVAVKDVEGMTQALLKIGVKKGNIDIKNLYSDIEEIYNKYIEKSLRDINLTQMVNEVFKVCRKNSISMPREIVMLLKGIITIEGVAAKLAPDINIMDIAVPYVRNRMLKDRDYKQDIMEHIENLYGLAQSGFKIPVKFLELMNSALAGKLKIQMEHTNVQKSINVLNRAANRIIFGLIVSSLIIGSSLVINAERGPKLYGVSVFGFIGYISAAIMGFWLLISIIKSGKM